MSRTHQARLLETMLVCQSFDGHSGQDCAKRSCIGHAYRCLPSFEGVVFGNGVDIRATPRQLNHLRTASLWRGQKAGQVVFFFYLTSLIIVAVRGLTTMRHAIARLFGRGVGGLGPSRGVETSLRGGAFPA